MSDVPACHPRSLSLNTRDKIVEGIEYGITSIHGLIAHGRGETFDYLIGEVTHPFAEDAIKAAAQTLILAQHPVISINGNVAALVPVEMIMLSRLLNAPIEVNLFHKSLERERLIEQHLKNLGATEILLPTASDQLNFIDSNRKYVNAEGSLKADVVFVPLEDGDRTEALCKMGKKVVTIDLNPLSRTAITATVTIVDNVIRAIPLLSQYIKEYQQLSERELTKDLSLYNNGRVLQQAERQIRQGCI